MSSAERERVIADETAIERKYSDALAQKAKDARSLMRENINNSWTTSITSDAPQSGELIGRVGLGEPNVTLDGSKDFYIGTAKYEGDDLQVFSWTAPIAACTYYRQPADRAHLEELNNAVVGVRVFAHQYDQIADYQDEAVGEADPLELFPRASLKVPRAPGVRSGAAQERSQDAPETTERPRPDVGPISAAGDASPNTGVEAEKVPGPKLRAPELLRRQLAAPKKAAMSAVLATLQPDQYEAITKPAEESQFLQGHPGTGKTIIGVHRAAYLLRSDAASELRPRGQVLILGPTAEYSAHVRDALRKLIDDDNAYAVMPISSLLEGLAGLPQSTVPTVTESYLDVDSKLARLVDEAYRKSRDNLDGAERLEVTSVYAELIRLLQDPPAEGLDPEWVSFLREMPTTFEEMKPGRDRRYRGLMAYIGARVERYTPNIGHIIVDEAQDVHPIEWEALGRIGNAGGWTILGDLNQRRNDHTFSSWDHIAQLLAIEREDGEAPVQVLERGYRSTAQIIQFANRLLPSKQRTLYSLQQDGEAPTVTRVPSAANLIPEAVVAIEALCERVARGTVGVIAMDPTNLQKAIVKRGWKRDRTDPLAWRKDAMLVRIMPPERARGLEFDGVLVIEPAEFPENVGRKGVLYTALTRANRYLVVMHHRALPRGIKATR